MPGRIHEFQIPFFNFHAISSTIPSNTTQKYNVKFLTTISEALTPERKPSRTPDTFKGRLSKVVSESVLDWPRAVLAPAVWDKVGKIYRLKPELKNRILADIENIPQTFRQWIYLIGSICTYNYNDRSDLDIHIVPPEDAPLEELEKWQEFAKAKSGRLIGQHPINYYLHDPGKHPYADSTYDVLRNKWIKWLPIKKMNLDKYYEKFREAIDAIDLNRAELYRDIVDLEELRDAYENASPRVRSDIENEITQKIDEINDEIDAYIDFNAELKDKRNAALHSEFPDEEARSALPDNVIFLLIRKYGYGSLAKALKDLRKEKEEISSPQDMKQIKKAFYTREFVDRINSL